MPWYTENTQAHRSNCWWGLSENHCLQTWKKNTFLLRVCPVTPFLVAMWWLSTWTHWHIGSAKHVAMTRSHSEDAQHQKLQNVEHSGIIWRSQIPTRRFAMDLLEWNTKSHRFKRLGGLSFWTIEFNRVDKQDHFVMMQCEFYWFVKKRKLLS